MKGLGADNVISYNLPDLEFLNKLQDVVVSHQQYDYVIDTVSSLDEKDQQYHYIDKLLYPDKWIKDQNIQLNQPPTQFMKSEGVYITLGGEPLSWIKSLLNENVAINLFPKGQFLFWIRFSNTSSQLSLLSQYMKDGKLRLQIANTLPFTVEGINEAMNMQMSRRTVGKILVQIASDIS